MDSDPAGAPRIVRIDSGRAVSIGLGLACVVLLLLTPASRIEGRAPAGRIDDRAFWRMFAEFSEPAGYFRSDNFLSNERTFQHVIPDLVRRVAPGGAYLGVGPEQNFTYLVALRPRIAFIIDIRRQNALLHLLYKALLEISRDRVEFLSHLFSRPRPEGLDRFCTPEALFDAYREAPPASDLRRQNLRAVRDQLVKRHHFPLTGDDLKAIEYVHNAFYTDGPDLSYAFSGSPGRRRFPTYAELMLQTDERGRQHSYLASDDNYQVLRDLERNNLVIPVVGDFAGDKAIRAVARYLADQGATVGAFYTSNVEFYLFQSDRWPTFFASARTLPFDRTSTFIRAASGNAGRAFGGPGLTRTLLDPIADLAAAVDEDRIRSYRDLIDIPRVR